MKYPKNLVGVKFGRLTVIEDSDERTSCGEIKYKCLCDCGNYSITARSELISGRATSCGCYWRERIKESRASLKGKPCNPNRKYITNEDRYAHYVFRHIKQRAKTDNIKFTLNFEQVENLIQSKCYYCNSDKSNTYKVPKFSIAYEYKYNGIDRIDSNLGYEDGNVVPCCKWCNQAKSTMSQTDFYNWVQRISKNFTYDKVIKTQ